MSSPRWFDEFPEYLTEADYPDLPEEISRTIETVHSSVLELEQPIRLTVPISDLVSG